MNTVTAGTNVRRGKLLSENTAVAKLYEIILFMYIFMPLWTLDCSMVFFLVFSINLLVWFVQ